ncbi:MAG TPA: extracellular solute-binding protein [Limnochordia bacterium]
MQTFRDERMWRHKLGGILAALLSLSTAGICGAQEAPPSPAARPPARSLTLTIPGPSLDDRFAEAALRGKIARFGALYPEVTIVIGPTVPTLDAFFVMHAAGSAPDIVTLPGPQIATLARGGYLADLTPLIDNWPLFGAIHPLLWEWPEWQGHIYAVPVEATTQGLLFDRRRFRERGLPAPPDNGPGPISTWADLANAAVRLTDKPSGRFGIGIPAGSTAPPKSGFAPGGSLMIAWIWQAGGPGPLPGNSGWREWLTASASQPAFEYWHDRRWFDDVIYPNVAASPERLASLLASGRIALLPGTPELVGTILAQDAAEAPDIGLQLLPAGPGGRASRLVASYAGVLSPPRDPDLLRAAFRWIAFDFEGSEIQARALLALAFDRPIGLPGQLLFKDEYQQQVDQWLEPYRNAPAYPYFRRHASEIARTEPLEGAPDLLERLGSALFSILTDPFADVRLAARRAGTEAAGNPPDGVPPGGDVAEAEVAEASLGPPQGADVFTQP